MNTELHKVFLEQLRDIYDAEHRIVQALPKMAKAANAEEVREAFEKHVAETRGQIERLDKVFESLDEKPKRKTCAAAKGLIEEAEEILKENKDSPALDAALIGAAQKVEHYEIATYGTLCTWAKLMKHKEALKELKAILVEEKNTDESLTEIALEVANLEAQAAS